MHAFGQKEAVPLADRLSLSPEEASALTGIGLTSIRQAINDGKLDALKAWLKTLPRIAKKVVSETGSDQ